MSDLSNVVEKPKRKKPFSATARCLVDLRKMGFLAGVVEKWNPHVRIRQDLFGCIDIIAARAGIGVLGINATAGDGNHTKHIAKAIAEPRLRAWLIAGGRYEVWTYLKRGDAGKRKLYTLRREEIKLEHLPAEPPEAGETLKLDFDKPW